METIIRHIITAAFLTSFVLSGCMEDPVGIQPTADEERTLRITASLPDADPATRLDYYESGKALKAYWSSDDQIIANAQPSNSNYIFRFDLVEGEGTSTGVFECKASSIGFKPNGISSNGWTLYFPGNKIQCEKDYLDFSYTGQIQRGNANTEHLKDYHSIRYAYGKGDANSLPFQDEFIDFSGDEYEESSCMKISLHNLPSITPVKVSLEYSAPSGESSSCFYLYNFIRVWWSGSFSPHDTKSHRISIDLEDFKPCTDATIYMMMSNYPVELKAGGNLTISVKSDEGNVYTCCKTLKSDATLPGGSLHSISGSSWELAEVDEIDGMDNPEDGIFVLQEASIGAGTDIIIMGDGFSKTHFGENGNYDKVMRQAYEDFFSIEPYASLKEYFNVYYINAVSRDDHDAIPLMNGATQGVASTIFSTQFTEYSTSITGDNAMASNYAMQAIRHKGGKGRTECSDEDEVSRRVNSSLMIVMVNVACHAGTCSISFNTGGSNDYCLQNSIAYTALNTSDDLRRLTLVHEAGGHGFGKLADEYGGYIFTQFNTNEWNKLDVMHNNGVYRNVNKHWGEEERNQGWSFSGTIEDTTEENVYWAELLDTRYDYKQNENLGIYWGAYTFDHFYCRATDNSVMRDQFSKNGHFFNAISRWAIWYRLMRLTGTLSASDFKSSLDGFIDFDNNIDIKLNTTVLTRSCNTDGLLPLAPPVLIEVK